MRGRRPRTPQRFRWNSGVLWGWWLMAPHAMCACAPRARLGSKAARQHRAVSGAPSGGARQRPNTFGGDVPRWCPLPLDEYVTTRSSDGVPPTIGDGRRRPHDGGGGGVRRRREGGGGRDSRRPTRRAICASAPRTPAPCTAHGGAAAAARGRHASGRLQRRRLALGGGDDARLQREEALDERRVLLERASPQQHTHARKCHATWRAP